MNKQWIQYCWHLQFFFSIKIYLAKDLQKHSIYRGGGEGLFADLHTKILQTEYCKW